LADGGLLRQVLAEELDRDGSAQADVLARSNLAHAAPTEQLAERVAPGEGGPRVRFHHRPSYAHPAARELTRFRERRGRDVVDNGGQVTEQDCSKGARAARARESHGSGGEEVPCRPGSTTSWSPGSATWSRRRSVRRR